ncbi:MAG: helix-turn-helix domain-containing protein [Poseidonia sp.]
MREVTLRWEKAALSHTAMAALDDVVECLTIMGNLMISTDGVRQLVKPTFRDGKGPNDLDELDFFTVEQELSEREGGALVVYNTHPLVRLAANTENIHILVPCDYDNGNFTITVRGLPKAVASFVRLSEAIIPPASVRVQTLSEDKEELANLLTTRQYECFDLAAKHGFYDEPKRITIQGLAEVKGIARSTFQEHLNAAEQAVLRWASSRLI